MERNLNTLKEVLWEQFEKATGSQESYERNNRSLTIAGRTSIADLAQAIVLVERELQARDDGHPMSQSTKPPLPKLRSLKSSGKKERADDDWGGPL